VKLYVKPQAQDKIQVHQHKICQDQLSLASTEASLNPQYLRFPNQQHICKRFLLHVMQLLPDAVQVRGISGRIYSHPLFLKIEMRLTAIPIITAIIM